MSNLNRTVLPITVDDKTFIVVQQVPNGFIWSVTDQTGSTIPKHPWADKNTKRYMGHDVPMTTHSFEGIVSHIAELLEQPPQDVSWLMTHWLADDDGMPI